MAGPRGVRTGAGSCRWGWWKRRGDDEEREGEWGEGAGRGG